MLQQLKIKNFQTHEKLIIQLDPSVTTITGRSDAGKSSIIRALRWLALNRPSGDSFVRHGTERSSVYLKILDKDSHIIQRRKALGNANVYQCDAQEYRAFGQSVPDIVREILNLDEINFQCQHDPPFWFMLSPGEVSRELNQIINLGLIDSTLANLSSELRQAKSRQNVAQERLESAKQEKTRLDWTEAAESDLDALETKQKKCTDLQEKTEELQLILTEIQEQRKIAKIQLPDEEIDRVESLQAQSDNISNKIRALTLLIQEHEATQREVCESRQQSEIVERELKQAMQGKCPVCGKTMS